MLSGSLVWIEADRVLAVGHQRASMASGELFIAGVAVVDEQEETPVDGMGNLTDPGLRDHRGFNPFARLGMDTIAVEEFEFFGLGWKPDFSQAVVFEGEVEFALWAKDFDGKGVEEFVGEDDQGSVGGERA